jgi:hypothetical protein
MHAWIELMTPTMPRASSAIVKSTEEEWKLESEIEGY